MPKKKKKVKETHLSDKHILNIELLLERKLNKKIVLEKQDAIIKNRNYQIEILKYKIDVLQRDAQSLIDDKKNDLQSYKNKDMEYKNFISFITKEYQIENDNWGFDPDTGKIVIEK